MKVLFAIAVTASLSAGVAYADCSYPPPPDHLPDGNTATLQEMVEAQKAVKEYDKAINAYVACIQLESKDAIGKIARPGETPTTDQKKAMDDMARVEVQKHNAAIDQLQSVADRFNEQVKVYKAKSADKSKG
jgi:pyruvoyl-dependent arginine decarboxylase (PvlArgDC)